MTQPQHQPQQRAADQRVPDEKRPLRTDLEQNKPENLNPAEPRRTLGHPGEPPGPDKDTASKDPEQWPNETFDAKGQVGAPGGPPVAYGMPPVPPEPGGRDPAVEALLRGGLGAGDPRDIQAHPTTPGDPPGRLDAEQVHKAQQDKAKK